jgi:hypothetical protein
LTAGYIGKQHLQDYFGSGAFERASGISLDPERTHVYLCAATRPWSGCPHRAQISPSAPGGRVPFSGSEAFASMSRIEPETSTASDSGECAVPLILGHKARVLARGLFSPSQERRKNRENSQKTGAFNASRFGIRHASPKWMELPEKKHER